MIGIGGPALFSFGRLQVIILWCRRESEKTTALGGRCQVRSEPSTSKSSPAATSVQSSGAVLLHSLNRSAHA